MSDRLEEIRTELAKGRGSQYQKEHIRYLLDKIAKLTDALNRANGAEIMATRRVRELEAERDLAAHANDVFAERISDKDKEIEAFSQALKESEDEAIRLTSEAELAVAVIGAARVVVEVSDAIYPGCSAGIWERRQQVNLKFRDALATYDRTTKEGKAGR